MTDIQKQIAELEAEGFVLRPTMNEDRWVHPDGRVARIRRDRTVRPALKYEIVITSGRAQR